MGSPGRRNPLQPLAFHLCPEIWALLGQEAGRGWECHRWPLPAPHIAFQVVSKWNDPEYKVSPLFPLWEGPSKKIFFNSLPEHTNFERTRKKFLIFILLLCYTCLKISSCSKYVSLEYHFSHSYISLSTFLLIFLRYDLFNNLTNTCMFIMCPNTFIYSSYKLFFITSIIVFTKGILGSSDGFPEHSIFTCLYDILNILCCLYDSFCE